MAKQDVPIKMMASTRRDVDAPDWVETAMFLRWVALAITVVCYWINDSDWFLAAGVVALAGPQFIVYHLYRRQNLVEAEIVFHNEHDGYCSGGEDGDGDGGD